MLNFELEIQDNSMESKLLLSTDVDSCLSFVLVSNTVVAYEHEAGCIYPYSDNEDVECMCTPTMRMLHGNARVFKKSGDWSGMVDVPDISDIVIYHTLEEAEDAIDSMWVPHQSRMTGRVFGIVKKEDEWAKTDNPL